jgi:hypothetical protein
MDLIFERGDRSAPAGHALVYFRTDDGGALATYCAVLPIAFDFTDFLPAIFKGAMEGMDVLGGNSVVCMPPVPQEVPLEYLQALAARRSDDLIYAGATMAGDPMRAAAVASEAAQKYGELYESSTVPSPQAPQASQPAAQDPDAGRFLDMTEAERLRELTVLTGRMRDSLHGGQPDAGIERQMESLASLLPPKYRAHQLVDAARTPGEKGQRLAELYLDRSFKLLHEEYLDLERIDREIEATQS